MLSVQSIGRTLWKHKISLPDPEPDIDRNTFLKIGVPMQDGSSLTRAESGVDNTLCKNGHQCD